MNELPDYTTPYLSENYTGPYISDGKLQTSVEFGTAEPKSKLDALSRLHDSAYAKFSDSGHRYAADSIYNEEAKKLAGLYPSLAGGLVLYGNSTSKSFSNLVSNIGFGVPGLVYGAVKNMVSLNDKVTNGDRYRKEVLAYYKTDPQSSLNQARQYEPALKQNSMSDQILPVYTAAEEPLGSANNFVRSTTPGASASPVTTKGTGDVNQQRVSQYDPFDSYTDQFNDVSTSTPRRSNRRLRKRRRVYCMNC